LLPYVDRNTLFRGQWRYLVHDRAEWQRLVETELEPRLRALWQDAKQKRWLQPRAIYGYFPVQADGNELVVYDPDDAAGLLPGAAADGASAAGASRSDAPAKPRELVRFSFPRQQPDGTKRNEEQLCLADYFRPVESGEYDVAALQVVTAGKIATDYVERLRAAGEYNTQLQVHGISVQAAEAMAEYVHQLVRRDLGLGAQQGNRYSWGYGACPDLEEQTKLFQLMPVTDSIGVRLTEGYQLEPEQSTAAIVVHHPQAKYFTVLSPELAGAEAVAAG
jgi:5-methyltetrahydrofolate--homocysteine methyltransferase